MALAVTIDGNSVTSEIQYGSPTMRLNAFDFTLRSPAVSPVLGDAVAATDPTWAGTVVAITTSPIPGTDETFVTVSATNAAVGAASAGPFGFSDSPDLATTFPCFNLSYRQSTTADGAEGTGNLTTIYPGIWPAMTFELTDSVLGFAAESFTATDVSVTWMAVDKPLTTITFGDPVVPMSVWVASKAADAPDGSISGTKITDDTITTPKLTANCITADKLAALLAWVSKLVAGDPSAGRIELDGTLADPVFAIYSPDNELMVRLGTDGEPMYFNGDLVAQTLTLIGEGEIRGAMSLAKDAVMTLQAGVQPPNAAPVLTQGMGPLVIGEAGPWDEDGALGQGYYDAVGGSDGATPCIVQVYGGAAFTVNEAPVGAGTERVTTLTGAVLPSEGIGGITRIGSYWYVTWTAAGVLWIGKYQRSDGAYVASVSGEESRFYSSAVYGPYPIKTDGTALYVVGHATSRLTLRAVKYNTSLVYQSSTTITLATAPTGSTVVTLFGAEIADISDGNGVCLFYDIQWTGGTADAPTVYQNVLSSGARVTGTEWESVWTTDLLDNALCWSGSNFLHAHYLWISWYIYSNIAVGGAYWSGYTWYDSVVTTHETTIGPRKSIVMLARRHLTITTAAIPVGGGDDPNRCRVYLVKAAADPGGTGYKLQATDALTSRTLSSYNAAGAADPATNDFTGGTGAVLRTVGGERQIKGNGDLVGIQPGGRLLVAIPFAISAITGTGTTDMVAVDPTYGRIQMLAGWAGCVVGVSVQLTGNRTAGTLSAQCYNGSTSALYADPSADIAASPVDFAYDTAAWDTSTFVAANLLRVRLTTVGFTQAAAGATAILYLMYDGVDSV